MLDKWKNWQNIDKKVNNKVDKKAYFKSSSENN